MKKIFVIDTNIILDNPNCIYLFEDNDICIPITVIEEIDSFKKSMNDLGRNARAFMRKLDEFRAKGFLADGVQIEEGLGKLFVFMESDITKLPNNFEKKADNLILSVCVMLKKKVNSPIILITKDLNMRIKSDALGIKCGDLEAGKVSIEDLYTGVAEFEAEESIFNEFKTKGRIDFERNDLNPNQFVILHNINDPDKVLTGRFLNNEINQLKHNKDVWGIHPRNMEQQFALDLLLDDNIKLVSLVGSAGTGKTLLSIAAGLTSVTERSLYSKLLVSRPVFPLGKDIGFLPGTVDEKMKPYMSPIYDNLDFLVSGNSTKKAEKNSKNSKNYKEAPLTPSYEELIEQGIIQVEPLTFIRGRSIPKQFFIIDEAQNLTSHEMKTIITRAGEGTKIILTGDPYQIDNPYIDASSNGLTYIVERFQNQSIAGHITLTKGERSELATIAANIL